MKHNNGNIKIEKNIPIPTKPTNCPDGSNKFHNGVNSYKWRCIRAMLKMEIGDSIKIEDRGRYIVYRFWLWRAELGTGFKYIVKSIDKYTQRVWRIK